MTSPSNMRKLYFILLASYTVAGCTHLTTPPDPTSTGGTVSSGYFWPTKDTSYTYHTYQGAVPLAGTKEIINISSSGNLLNISDKDLASGNEVSYVDTNNGGTETVNLLSNQTLFRLSDSSVIIGDSNIHTNPVSLKVTAITSDLNKTIYVAADKGFFVFDTSVKRFVQRGSIGSSSIFSLLYNNFAGPNGTFYAASKQDGIFQSTDLGANWTRISSGATATNVGAITLAIPGIYAAVGGQIFQYNGSTWSSGTPALPDNVTQLLAFSNSHGLGRLIALTSSGRVVRYSI